MKKLLLASLLATVCGFASAQSNVTLYGTIDAGVYNINNASATQNASGLVDSSMTSSIWGLKGSEDLGGGTRAVFNLEGDLQSNNGGLNQNGIFRRAANVGLVNAQLGELDLGVKMNPLIASWASILPVAGNSVNNTVKFGLGFADDFTKNAITYTSPEIAGLTASVQYGAANQTGDTGDYTTGSVVAYSLKYSAIPGLNIIAAGQERHSGGTASVSANSNSPEKTTYLGGANYALGDLSVGASYVSNKTDSGSAVGNVNAYLVGLGYKLTPQVRLGANYVKTNDSSTLTNIQAHYDFSKRTEVYAQLGYAQNGTSTSNPLAPIFQTTGNSPGVDVNGYSNIGVAGVNQMGLGAGIIHRF